MPYALSVYLELVTHDHSGSGAIEHVDLYRQIGEEQSTRTLWLLRSGRAGRGERESVYRYNEYRGVSWV